MFSFLDSICQRIEHELEDRGRKALRLGLHIESFDCPPETYRHMYEQQDVVSDREGSPLSLGEDAHHDPAPALCHEPVLVNCSFQSGELEPASSWRGILLEFWKDFPLDEEELPTALRTVGCRPPSTQVLQELDETVRRILRQLGTPLREKHGHLGLVLDLDHHRVRREGFDDIVEIKGLLRWKMLLQFFRNGESRISLRRLKVLWSLHGVEKNPEPNTIYSEISKLNFKIKQLDIEINNQRNIGWRLEVSRQPPC